MQISVTNLWGVITPLRTTTGIYALPPGAVNVTLSLPDFEATEIASRVVLGQIAVTYLVPPIVQSRPAPATITGTSTPGGVLTATAAGLGSATYQWLSNAAPISGATSAIYAVQAGDVGATISCLVTGTDQSNGLTIRPARAAVVTSAAPTLPKFKAAVAGVKAGTRRATVLYIGTSIPAGEHNGDNTSSVALSDTNVVKNNTVAALSAALSAAGVPAVNASALGDIGCAVFNDVPFPTFNPQWAQTGGVGTNNYTTDSNSSIGGSEFVITSVNSDNVQFTPQTAVDHVRWLCIRLAASGGFNPYTVGYNFSDDGTLRTAAIGNDGGLQWAELQTSMAAATRTAYLNLQTSGGVAAVVGAYGYNSKVPAVDILNVSIRGSKAANWASNTGSGHSYVDAIKFIAPDLTIIQGVANDFVGGTSLSSMSASYNTVITAAKASGDVLLVNDPAYQYGGTNAGNTIPPKSTRDTYTAVMNSMVSQYGLPPLTDLEARLGPWSATGWYDALHLLKTTAASSGQAIAADVLSYIQ